MSGRGRTAFAATTTVRSDVRRRLLRLAVATAGAALARRAVAAGDASAAETFAGTVRDPDGGDGSTRDAANRVPRWLTTARFGPDDFRAVALDADGRTLAERLLPTRAHAVAVHAARGVGCVFARRPGNWFCTFDVADLAAARVVDAPSGRRFSGHGAYSRDAARLYTSENDIDRARGVIGVHDVANGHRRVAELDSHGIGPHEIVGVPGTDLLVVANGGIATHPDHGAGRLPLNLDTMAPNVVVLDARDGTLLARHVLPDEHHRVSLRHLAVDGARRVWFAGQYGREPDDRTPVDGASMPLAGSFSLPSRHGHAPSPGAVRDAPFDVLELPSDRVPRYQAYLSSVASDGTHVLYTASRDGVAFRVDAASGALDGVARVEDGSGVAPAGADGDGFVVTNGFGEVLSWRDAKPEPLARADCAWDNHVYRSG